MTFFEAIDLQPNDPIFFLNTLFKADERPEKVNLGVGIYTDGTGELKTLKSVLEAEKRVHNAQLNKNYPPLDGETDFVKPALKLIFGELDASDGQKLYGAQAVGGTGALRIGAAFIAENFKGPIYIPNPTWANHHRIFTHAKLEVKEYPYYDQKMHKLCFAETCQAIEAMPKGSSMLLHACCHNPSGMDFSDRQWLEVSQLLKKKQILPFFDFAYQGFGTDFESDAKAVRLFRQEGHELLVAYSFSKNMGLYGERVGLLAFAAQSEKITTHIASHVKPLIRGMYSMGPLHGTRIAAAVLNSKQLYRLWQEEVMEMKQRVTAMRNTLIQSISRESDRHDFTFLTQQKGLFSYSGLKPEQVVALREQYSVFMTADGRINIAGLNSTNIDYVVEAIAAVLNL